MPDDLDEPLHLPLTPTAPARPALPIAAAVVPVVGAVVLWRLTGSVYALWFAALGPLMAAASFLDGWRSGRRTMRRARRAAAATLTDLHAEVTRRHEKERERAWRRTPDLAGFADDPDEIWRSVPARHDTIVVGRGTGVSTLRLAGEPHDDATRTLRRSAHTVDDVPVVVPLTAGIAVCGPEAFAAAVVRALALQVCVTQPPGQVRIAADSLALASVTLPHAQSPRGAALYIGAGDRPVPAEADIPIVYVAEGAPSPPRCAAVLTLGAGDTARLDHDGVSRQVRVEAVSGAQAEVVATALASRAETLGQHGDSPVTLSELSATVGEAHTSLRAVVGIAGGEPVTVDLVADGPHAVVIGVTGSGKSELLTTWIVGMCQGRASSEVAFLLVDFKGGRTFDALADLPHVTGVLTDLDGEQALRAVESLRAEVRHRERVLAGAGARDVDEAGGALGRLVIVVDEYAALVTSHPELHDVFADIAARGRALGMHLVLASQRAGGAFRDGVLANAPLRIALRVTDAADSRTILGVDDAAHLPGVASARGVALIRRGADAAPRAVRIARCDGAALHALREAVAGMRPARRPWLAPLPARISVGHAKAQMQAAARASGTAAEAAPGELIALGLADEPEQQRQPVVTLALDSAGFAVIGGPGSGRTTLLRTVAAQAREAVWVPADLESAWDLVMGADKAAAGTTVLIDDADALAARFAPDYAAAWLAALDRVVREARTRGITVVVSATRVSGTLSRTLDLLPQRAILALPTRADHVAAGGEAADFDAVCPPGRGRWGRTLVQFATAEQADSGATESGETDPELYARLQRRAAPAPVHDVTAPSWRPDPGAVGPAALVLAPGLRGDDVRRACADRGLRVIDVADAAASASGEGESLTVLAGSPEEWLAQWRALSDARSRGELVIDAECAAEYRAVTGRRDLPPYVHPGAGRAWALVPGIASGVRRVTLPGIESA